MSTDVPVLVARGLTKRYGAIEAVVDVDLHINPSEIVAVVGDNGAGKTSLVKMLAGALDPDSGAIYVHGEEVRFGSVIDARRHGIEMVYQDLALIGTLDVTANFLLGREFVRPSILGRLGFLDRPRMREVVRAELQRLNVKIPRISGQPVSRLSGGQRQAVAVARAIYWTRDVLILDEPTAALGVAESAAVLDLITRSKETGTSVVIISHILPHVIELADRVIVMRQGRKVGDMPKSEIRSQEHLVRMIVGLDGPQNGPKAGEISTPMGEAAGP